MEVRPGEQAPSDFAAVEGDLRFEAYGVGTELRDLHILDPRDDGAVFDHRNHALYCFGRWGRAKKKPPVPINEEGSRDSEEYSDSDRSGAIPSSVPGQRGQPC